MKGATCCPQPRHSAGQKARQCPLVALPARAVRCAPRLRGQRARRACWRAARAGRGRAQGWRRPPAPGAPHLGGHGSPMVPGAGPGGPVPLRARTAELRGPASPEVPLLRRKSLCCRLFVPNCGHCRLFGQTDKFLIDRHAGAATSRSRRSRTAIPQSRSGWSIPRSPTLCVFRTALETARTRATNLLLSAPGGAADAAGAARS